MNWWIHWNPSCRWAPENFVKASLSIETVQSLSSSSIHSKGEARTAQIASEGTPRTGDPTKSSLWCRMISVNAPNTQPPPYPTPVSYNHAPNIFPKPIIASMPTLFTISTSTFLDARYWNPCCETERVPSVPYWHTGQDDYKCIYYQNVYWRSV